MLYVFVLIYSKHQELAQQMKSTPTVVCDSNEELLQNLEDQIQLKTNQMRIITQELGSFGRKPCCCFCCCGRVGVVNRREANTKFLQRLKSIKDTLQKRDLHWD